MKKRNLFLLTVLPFFLLGCADDIDPRAIKTFPELNYGDKVTLTPSSITNYFIVNTNAFSYYDEYGSVYSIILVYSTFGYYALSYYVDSIECEYTFDWLGDDGDIHTSKMTITVNPDKNGDSYNAVGTAVNYRSVNNFRITDYNCGGFVVKK